MTLKQFVKPATAATALAAVALVGIAFHGTSVRADDIGGDASRIHQGFAIAPVQLNLRGKDPALVGLGSYIVNAQASCNDCHTLSPQAEYSPGGIPYFGQHPTIVNPAVYLGGGRDFGPVAGPGTPDIVSRNLTPDKTGLPEGGHTFAQFVDIMRNGTDYDHFHPTCVNGVLTGTCLPAPFDGALLQIMPWPILHNLTDHDLLAIYEYLSAVPCIAGPPAPSILHNDCQ